MTRRARSGASWVVGGGPPRARARAPLDALHPFTPVAAAVALVALAYAGPQPWSAAVALVAACALAVRWRIARPVVRLALVVAVPTWLLLALMDGVLAPSAARVVFAGPIPVSLDGLAGATAISLRLAAAVAALGAVIIGVRPRRLARALADRGLPGWGAYLLVASLEAVPQARRRAAEVIEAQRCRGLGAGRGVLARLRAILPLAGPLAVGLVTEAEERALALDARGFRPGRARTALDPVRDRTAERRLRLALWIATGALLAWGLLA